MRAHLGRPRPVQGHRLRSLRSRLHAREHVGHHRRLQIDLYHALWVTNERDQNFGSIYGYPRLGYAYRYWWTYWFRWAIADRAFERKADPSVLVYHPEGEFVDETTGASTSYADYALTMGERMRSGGVIALPSEVYEDATGGHVRQWEIDFTQNATDFDPFDKSFEYLDIAKLRALAIPEQAFFEGRGGTSSRNVAAEMQSSFTESQAVLSAQIVESINRWLIPQWLAVNYPGVPDHGGHGHLRDAGLRRRRRDLHPTGHSAHRPAAQSASTN